MSNEKPKAPAKPEKGGESAKNESTEGAKFDLKSKLAPLKEKIAPILSKLQGLKEPLEEFYEALEPARKSFNKFISNLKKGVIEVDLEFLKNVDPVEVWEDFLDFIESSANVDRKKLKLVGIIVLLLGLFVFDVFWIVLPNKPEHKVEEDRQEYKLEEVAEAMAKYQHILIEDPENYEAFIEIGKLHRTLDEIEKAKVAFFQALEVAPDGDYNAKFSLASLYIKDGKPFMAQKILDEIKGDNLEPEVLKRKGRYYFDLSVVYYSLDYFLEANSCLNISIKNYEKAGAENEIKKVKDDKKLLLIDLADYVYYNYRNVSLAMEYLDESLKIEDNPWALARKGYLFFESPKVASEYFERAFNYNPKTVNHEVFMNVLYESIKKAGQEHNVKDKEYYQYMLSRVRSENYKSKIFTKLFLNNVEAYLEKSEDSDDYVPVVYFQVGNSSDKVEREYVKVRVVFYRDNNKIIGHKDQVIVKPLHPLLPEASTKVYRMASNRFVSLKDFEKGIYKVVLYISKDRPDEWFLAKSTFVKKH